MENNNEIAVFGGGCFWCTEAIFQNLKGVVGVKPGYSGGAKANPTYEEVSEGQSGHVEVTRVEFDPAKITFGNLLDVFFATHDPTTMNRQGNDIGAQYNSVIFYTTDSQKAQAEEIIKQLDGQKVYSGPIVTKVRPLDKFYEAEDYHKNYYERNKDKNPYCQIVINPKLEKLKKKFADKLK